MLREQLLNMCSLLNMKLDTRHDKDGRPISLIIVFVV